MARFTTMTDAEVYVSQTLGAFAEDFDVPGIARTVTDLRDGALTLVVDGDEYWDVVRAFELD